MILTVAVTTSLARDSYDCVVMVCMQVLERVARVRARARSGASAAEVSSGYLSQISWLLLKLRPNGCMGQSATSVASTRLMCTLLFPQDKATILSSTLGAWLSQVVF